MPGHGEFQSIYGEGPDNLGYRRYALRMTEKKRVRNLSS